MFSNFTKVSLIEIENLPTSPVVYRWWFPEENLQLVSNPFVDINNLEKNEIYEFRICSFINELNSNFSDIKVSLIDTGLETMTGGRLKRIEKYIGDDEEFLLTYGDAVSDVDINELIKFHHKNKTSSLNLYPHLLGIYKYK